MGKATAGRKTAVKASEWVLIQGPPSVLPRGGVRQDAVADALAGVIKRRLDEVKADWTQVLGQVADLLSTTPSTLGPFELDSVEFSLGFNAEGKLLFIANAGVEASVTLALKRVSTKSSKA